MILGSLGIFGAVIALTIVMPIVGESIEIGYWAIAIIVSLAILLVTLLTAWIGWTLLTTEAPEAVLDETAEEDLDTTEDEEGSEE